MKTPPSGEARTPQTRPAVWMSLEVMNDATNERPIVRAPKKETSTPNTQHLLKAKIYYTIHHDSFPVASPQHKRQVRNKSVTSCRGQRSVVCVVSCRFPNSITTTCCQLVMDLLAVSLTSRQQVGNFPVYGIAIVATAMKKCNKAISVQNDESLRGHCTNERKVRK